MTLNPTKPRRYSRVVALGPDPRIAAIQDAARACDAAGRSRAHIMAGEYQWPRGYVASLDELKLFNVPAAQIIAYGYAFLNAAIVTALDGDGRDKPLGEVLAREARAEGEANEATALLVDAPLSESHRRALLDKVTKHIAALEEVRRVLLAAAQ